jgi:hypothetical protein
LDGGGTESSRQLRLRLAGFWLPPPLPPLPPPPLGRMKSTSPWEQEPREAADPSSERMELTEVTESMDISLPQDSRTLSSPW